MEAFFCRSKLLFSRWLELAGVDKRNPEELVDLFLREQFLASVSPALVVFLKERELATVNDYVSAAERYRMAHDKQSMAAKASDSVWQSSAAAQCNTVTVTGTERGGGRGAFTRGRGRGGRGGVSRGSFNNGRTGKGASADQNTQPPNQPQLATHNTTNDVQGSKRDKMQCFTCKGFGHSYKVCPSKTDKVFSAGVGDTDKDNLLLCEGTLNGKPVEVMLDSGCTTVGVAKCLVSPHQYTGEVRRCRQFAGDVIELPVAMVDLDTPYFVGKVSACVIENPISDVILGRIPGANLVFENVTAAVQTRAQRIQEQRPFRPLLTPKAPKLDVGPAEIQKMQKNDATLIHTFEKVGGQVVTNTQGDVSFVLKDGLLYRRTYKASTAVEEFQLVVPQNLRESVLVAAHDGIFGGHMGVKSTFKRITPHFYWPGYWQDVQKYCKTCDTCQKMSQKGRVQPVPLQNLPVIDTPFARVGIDLIGPITPTSSQGHRYVLTLVDFATRYPEAIPLKTIDTEAVTEALMQIFSRLGIPSEILSDQGTQFKSELFQSVMKLLSVNQSFSTPYHAQTNGLVERFNGTLKSMIKKLMHDKPTDWHRYLQAALFAYREIPQESTGFSPFELMYGRTPRGPMQVLSDVWTGKTVSDETKTVYQYVIDLKDTMSDMIKLAQSSLQNSGAKAKLQYDKKAKSRSLQVNDEVLVLLPTDHSKLLLKWKGPFKVVKKQGVCDYVIQLAAGKTKTFHINMLKKYERRTPVTKVDQASVAVLLSSITEPDEDIQSVDVRVVPTVQTETVANVQYNPDLSNQKLQEIKSVIGAHSKIMTDLPGTVHTIEHTIRNGDVVVNQRQYPLPFESEKVISDEVQKMLEMDIIEPSNSPYSSPVVLVKKPDNSVRFCIDFRGLNGVTLFDSEPIPDQESLFISLKDKEYFTKIDLAKGYWQVPLSEQDKPKTAFRTPQGLFQFTKMPFGLATAPSTFARMMRQLKLEELGCISFFDDILVASQDWQSHLTSLDKLLTRLEQFGLTVRPSKVQAGFQEIEFLGHMIGKGRMRPVDKKVTKILKVNTPKTKKQVRALIGLAGYYRRYIPKFSEMTAPLTELTKKNKPAKVKWTDECEASFVKIKDILSNKPVVALPDFSRPFTVRTDASSTGIAGVLMQPDDQGLMHPVLYASRKLLDRETRYSAIERECLAIVWSVDKFSRYLTGRHFCIETDHRPLTYLQSSKTSNSRLMRWALALQEFQFSVLPISGNENVEADVLSRLG
jgi:hypothetical protein